MKKAASKKPKAEKAPKADPVRNGSITAAVKKNQPANWPGTEKQYLALYGHNLTGLQQQIEKAFGQLYPEAARVAMIKNADLETPVVELVLKVKLDFTDLEVAQFNGALAFEEKKKHDASVGFVEELNPKGPGRQTDMISNPPTDKSPKLTVIAGTKTDKPNAPDNKSAPAATNKAGAKPRAAEAPKTPAAPAETAQPGDPAPAAPESAATGT